MGFGGYYLSDLDRKKSSGERRFEALTLLSGSPRTPGELATLWDITDTSAYRVLERLRKYKCVARDQDHDVMGSSYSITERGLGRLEWFLGQTALGSMGGLPQGPVSLMRLVDADSIDAVADKYPDLAVEKKYDGWLVQTVDGELYSRRGKVLTDKFIPISRALQKYKKARLVGELVYFNSNGKMDESSVTRVAGTKDPVEAARKMAELETRGLFQLVFFDILEKNGKDLTGEPFAERSKILRETVRAGTRQVRIAIAKNYPLSRWEDAYEDALEEGGEGVVLKNRKATYLWAPLGDSEPHKVGYMWKLKEIQSDDFVVYDSYRTEKGSLIVVFGQYDGRELVNVGEMNNFSQEREKEILKKLKKGKFLMEIAFQERFPKPPGKLRNPRFLRFREDLTVRSAKLPAKYR